MSLPSLSRRVLTRSFPVFHGLSRSFTAFCAAQGPRSDNTLDIPVRPGVCQRIGVVGPSEPGAVCWWGQDMGGWPGWTYPSASDGPIPWGQGHFLVCNRHMFPQAAAVFAEVGAASSRASPACLHGYARSPSTAPRSGWSWPGGRTPRHTGPAGRHPLGHTADRRPGPHPRRRRCPGQDTLGTRLGRRSAGGREHEPPIKKSRQPTKGGGCRT
jgi:hypothetical protein